MGRRTCDTLDVGSAKVAPSDSQPPAPAGSGLGDRNAAWFATGLNKVVVPAGTLTNMVVTIDRKAPTGSFGFGLGSSRNEVLLVSSVVPGGVSDGRLKAGDEILRIEGAPTAGLDYEEVIGIIKAATAVTLDIRRAVAPAPDADEGGAAKGGGGDGGGGPGS